MTVKNGKAIADLTGCTPGILTVFLTDEKRQTFAQRVFYGYPITRQTTYR